MSKVQLILIICTLVLGPVGSARAQTCVCDFTSEELEQSFDSVVLCATNPASCLCAEAIPTVSEWGLVIVTLLGLTAGTMMIGHRRRESKAFGCMLLLVSMGSLSFWAAPVVFGHTARHGTAFTHSHPTQEGTREFTDDEKACINQEILGKYEGIEKVSGPSVKFNCAGHALDASGSYIKSAAVALALIDSLYDKQPAGTDAQEGDRITYKDGAGNLIHVGIVTGVDEEGNVTEVTSKWGPKGVYKHPPATVPPSYGTNRNLWR